MIKIRTKKVWITILKIKLIIFGLIISLNLLFSQNKNEEKLKIFGYGYDIKFMANTGIMYDIKISTDSDNQQEAFSLNIPLSFTFDFRYIELYSFNPTIEFMYNLYCYINNYGSNDNVKVSNKIYNHNFFIRMPLLIKLYPLVYKNDFFSDFYISLGAVLNFWILNYYYYNVNDKIKYGNGFFPKHKEVPPEGVYTPVNLGIKIAIGNLIDFEKGSFAGLELFLIYLFLPEINGYYNNINYNLSSNIILNFSLNIGIQISIGGYIKKY